MFTFIDIHQNALCGSLSYNKCAGCIPFLKTLAKSVLCFVYIELADCSLFWDVPSTCCSVKLCDTMCQYGESLYK